MASPAAARSRRRHFVDARNQPVDRTAIGRKDFAARRGIGIEPVAEGTLHVAAAQEGLS